MKGWMDICIDVWIDEWMDDEGVDAWMRMDRWVEK